MNYSTLRSRLLYYLFATVVSFFQLVGTIDAQPTGILIRPIGVDCFSQPSVVSVAGDVASWTSSSTDDLYRFKLEDRVQNLVLDEHNVIGTSTIMSGLQTGVTYRVTIAPRCSDGTVDTAHESYIDFVKSIDGVIHGDVQTLIVPPVANPPANTLYCYFSEVRSALQNNTVFPVGHICEPFNATLQQANGFTTPFRQLILEPQGSILQTRVFGTTWLGIGSALGTRYDNYTVFSVTNRVSSPLPVELVEFKASANQYIDLQWATATEKNSDRFEVQRSANGQDFETLGTLAAAKSSNTLQRYSFADKKPKAGFNYYRLKMVDVDGTTEYSDIRAVYFLPKTVDWCQVYPTDVTDVVTVQLTSQNKNSTTAIRLTNALGAAVLQQTIPAETDLTTLQIGDLPSGLYYLHLQQGDHQFVQKLLKK